MPAKSPPQGPPEYRVYRSRRNPFSRRDSEGFDRLRKRDDGPRRVHGRRRPLSLGRVVKWLAVGATVWLLVSLLAFLVSAQIQQGKVGEGADELLGGGGYPLTSANTVLVLGSDTRSDATAEPGAQTTGTGRADSILLVRTGGGANARLSIARDTMVDIPGQGRQRINAAYAIGGAPLAIQTVEQYLGVDINHLVEVSFDNFPELIDAMGGITYRGGCVVSRINGGFRNGGFTLRLPAGKSHLDGRQALALARTRTNLCNRDENDLTRAARQQKILGAMKRRMLHPVTFLRLPLVSWEAPQALQSDMSGPTLLGLIGALGSSGSPPTRVLGSVDGEVSEERRAREVRRFLEG